MKAKPHIIKNHGMWIACSERKWVKLARAHPKLYASYVRPIAVNISLRDLLIVLHKFGHI